MNIESSISTQSRNTLIASAVSALICGIFLVDNLIFWLPGAPFGILYAIANFHRKRQVGLFTVVSSILYIVAVQIFFRAAGSNGENLWLGGFLAGAFGAFTLSLLTKLMSKTSLRVIDEVRSTLVGAIMGIIFVRLVIFSYGQAFSNGVTLARLLLPVAFASWQIPVAWLLSISAQPTSHELQGISENAHG
jgi:hypothetical protein